MRILICALVLSGVGMVRKQAKRMACASSLRQIGMAFEAYAQDNEGQVPYVALIPPTGLGSAIRWAEFLSDYTETRRTAGGTIDLSAGKSVLTGCSEWKATQVWVLGYGMNSCLRRTAQAGSGDATYQQTNRTDLRLATPDPHVVIYQWAAISFRSARLLLTDTIDYHTMSSVIDVKRHGTRFNALFCDLHVQSLADLSQAVRAIDTPDLGLL